MQYKSAVYKNFNVNASLREPRGIRARYSAVSSTFVRCCLFRFVSRMQTQKIPRNYAGQHNVRQYVQRAAENFAGESGHVSINWLDAKSAWQFNYDKSTIECAVSWMQHAAVISLSVRPFRSPSFSIQYRVSYLSYPILIFSFSISLAARFQMADIADSLMPWQHHDRSLAGDASVQSNSPREFRVISQWR